jgi:hypothetical protein
MLTGKPVTVDEFKTTLLGEVAINRLSAYMWIIKKLGGNVKAHREGHKVVAYELLNADEMKAKVADMKASNEVKKKEPHTYHMITVPKKSDRKDGMEEIPSWVDPDFDETDISDIVG